MGWSWTRATHYDKKGRIDRKAECDALFNNNCRIERSVIVGSVYYAAVTVLRKYVCTDTDKDARVLYEIPAEEQETFAAVILTGCNMSDYYNFGTKYMDETVGPVEAECPISIINLLTPTNDEYARIWRERCKKHAYERRLVRVKQDKLSKLQYGTKIKFTDRLGRKCIAVKMAPNKQFKRYWWYLPDCNRYYSKSRIPCEFEVLDIA